MDLRKINATDILFIFKEEVTLIGHDLKNSLQVLLELGVKQTTIFHDILIAAFLINSLDRVQSIDELAASELNLDVKVDSLDDDELVEQAAKITSLIRLIANVQGEKMSELTGIIKLIHRHLNYLP